jgi:hypothetical protein
MGEYENEYKRERINEKDAIRVYKVCVTPDIARLEQYMRELDPPKEPTKKNAFFGRNKETLDLDEIREFLK